MEGGSGGKEPESVEETLSRHRKEIKELQNKEMNMKKAAAKGSKAEQKAKKRQVEEDISRLSSKLKAKHEEELVSLGCKNNLNNGTVDVNDIIIGLSGMSTSQRNHQSKPSKSLKRREKRAQQEAAREQRIQEEQSSIVSDRLIEKEKLERKLEPLGLTVNEIKPDGHCLYRAVEDQLSHQSGSPPYNYQELRVMAATYMREHASDFLPFFLSDKDIEADSDMSLLEKFESYCTEVETTAAWGGQLELGALTHCLRKHIIVFSGSFPDVEMGKEYKSDSSDNALPNSSVILSYHRHAFGLGEHYNSVISNFER